MNPETGKIISGSKFDLMPEEQKKDFVRLTDSEYSEVAHLNRKERREWARKNKKGKWAV